MEGHHHFSIFRGPGTSFTIFPGDSPHSQHGYFGAIFAYGIRPLALKIEPKLKFRSLAIAVAMVVVILPLIALLAYSINTLISSSSTLVELTEA